MTGASRRGLTARPPAGPRPPPTARAAPLPPGPAGPGLPCPPCPRGRGCRARRARGAGAAVPAVPAGPGLPCPPCPRGRGCRARELPQHGPAARGCCRSGAGPAGRPGAELAAPAGPGRGRQSPALPPGAAPSPGGAGIGRVGRGGRGAPTRPREVLLLSCDGQASFRLVERKILGIGRLAGTPGSYLKRPQGQKSRSR
ncbi:uncharacterized protein [Taeniopygia guttata]|uniref:uncharacterized protein isoform X2 n=1 Tax=Taeniopygia guttata TaxID=59729 RepID=UPI003BB928C0